MGIFGRKPKPTQDRDRLGRWKATGATEGIRSRGGHVNPYADKPEPRKPAGTPIGGMKPSQLRSVFGTEDPTPEMYNSPEGREKLLRFHRSLGLPY